MSSEFSQLSRWLAMADVEVKRTLKAATHEKVIACECLVCLAKNPKNIRRGLCDACYLRFVRYMQTLPRKERIEHEEFLIRDGKVLASRQISEIRRPNPFARSAS